MHFQQIQRLDIGPGHESDRMESQVVVEAIAKNSQVAMREQQGSEDRETGDGEQDACKHQSFRVAVSESKLVKPPIAEVQRHRDRNEEQNGAGSLAQAILMQDFVHCRSASGAAGPRCDRALMSAIGAHAKGAAPRWINMRPRLEA